MFLMATVDRCWTKAPAHGWPTGTDKMLIISVGTGTSSGAKDLKARARALGVLDQDFGVQHIVTVAVGDHENPPPRGGRDRGKIDRGQQRST
jgi:hypothetical protein